MTPAQRQAQVAYSQCMRSHGVADFPDPNSQGQLLIHGGPGSDLNPDNPTFKNAQKACQSIQPKPTQAQQAQAQRDGLRRSQCMRAHGIKDYPDPSSNGSMSIHAQAGGDLDPNNPLFQRAWAACMPGVPRPSGGVKTGNGPGGSISISGGRS